MPNELRKSIPRHLTGWQPKGFLVCLCEAQLAARQHGRQVRDLHRLVEVLDRLRERVESNGVFFELDRPAAVTARPLAVCLLHKRRRVSDAKQRFQHAVW
jgi:hypothetical protein